MSIQYWFTLLAIGQGALVLGLTIFIFFYYFPKTEGEVHDHFRWWKIAAAASYILLTIATIQTAVIRIWPWGDFWYWCVIAAYGVGDVSLVVLFRDSVIKRRKEKLIKK